MTVYVIRGSTVFPQEDADNYQNKLPAATHNVGLSIFGWFLERTKDVQKDPEKVYGNVDARASRIIQTFEERSARDRSTGVLLTGVKGSGKTMLARMVSTKMHMKGIPSIIVDNTVTAENVSSFIKFMNLIDVPAVVLFDEFEKNFDTNLQSQMLTMFDGLGSGNKLFMLTINDEHKLHNFMLNRPGRIYYRFDYRGLESDFVLEYLNDALVTKDRIEETANKINKVFKNNFTFDMLQAAVEEMNRFDISFTEAVSCLNIDVESVAYSVVVFKGKKQVANSKVESLESFMLFSPSEKHYIEFDYDDHFKMYDAVKNAMIFENEQYSAEVRTERTSNRNKSYFMDLI